MALLQAININKTWKDKTIVLNSVSLEVSQGQIIAIVGKSGCGKSTFLQICGLLDNPTFGKIIIDGNDCSNMSDFDQTIIRRNKIGFIYQFHHLLEEFNVIENLIIPQLIYGTDEKAARKNAMTYLEKVNLANKENSSVSNLSGGEKQRVAIIRSIINNPKLIIADEPTGSLDNNNSIVVFNLLKELVENRGTSMIIATHSLEIAKLCSLTVSLENGNFIWT
jgi:lipoprotein-releasing system ATP-binding protein